MRGLSIVTLLCFSASVKIIKAVPLVGPFGLLIRCSIHQCNLKASYCSDCSVKEIGVL
jgi:hypothetical protein